MNDGKSGSLKIYGIVAVALLTVATVAHVAASFAELFDKFHWTIVLVAAVNLVGIVAAVQAVKLGLGANGDGALLVVKSRREMEDRIEAFWKGADPRRCREIDIMGLSLRRELFRKNSEFSQWLCGCLQTNPAVRVRIILADPNKEDLLAYRETAEEAAKGRLRTACKETLETLLDIATSIWNEQRPDQLHVVLISTCVIYQWMFRIDDTLFVSPYLQHDTGPVSPVFELNRGSRWFGVFQGQFERSFARHKDNVFPPKDILTSGLRQP